MITEVDRVVPSAKWQEFKTSYRSMVRELPPLLVRTYLLQDTQDPTVWRVATIWRSEGR